MKILTGPTRRSFASKLYKKRLDTLDVWSYVYDSKEELFEVDF